MSSEGKASEILMRETEKFVRTGFSRLLSLKLISSEKRPNGKNHLKDRLNVGVILACSFTPSDFFDQSWRFQRFQVLEDRFLVFISVFWYAFYFFFISIFCDTIHYLCHLQLPIISRFLCQDVLMRLQPRFYVDDVIQGHSICRCPDLSGTSSTINWST